MKSYFSDVPHHQISRSNEFILLEYIQILGSIKLSTDVYTTVYHHLAA